MTWAEFYELFIGKYFQATARHAKAQEFIELKQGTMTMNEYVARFTEIARFADDYVATDLAKVMRFENGLRLSIRARIVGIFLQDMDSMVGTTMTIERGIEDARSIRDAGAVARGRRVSLLPVRERSPELLVHMGSKAAVIRAREGSGLPVRLGRWCATIASNLDI